LDSLNSIRVSYTTLTRTDKQQMSVINTQLRWT